MKKPAAKKVAKKTMAAKKPVRKMEDGGMSGDPVKPKKDRWGRPEGSKYYSFNPATKKYEDKAKQAAFEKKQADADIRLRLMGNPGAMKTPRPDIFKKGGKVTARKKK